METKTLTEVPAGSSVVVFRMFATNPPNIGMLFLRDRDGATPPMLFKGNSPTHLLWHAPLPEQTYAFVVPPGRWHMAEFRFTSFCLGGPAFDLAPGEALFAGSFDAQKPFMPDMALEPAQNALGDTALAKQLHPARSSNGASFACDAVPANTIYVLEYPGLAFDKDYASGSRAPKKLFPPQHRHPGGGPRGGGGGTPGARRG